MMEAMDQQILLSALDAVSETVVILNPDAAVVYANARFYQQMDDTGASTTDAPATDTPGSLASGIPLRDYFQSEPAQELLDGVAAAFRGETNRFTGLNILNRHDESEDITCTPLVADTGPTIKEVVITARPARRLSTPGKDNPYEYQDPVTGLLNRRSIKLVTDREIQRANRGTPTMAMLFVMLRNFKQINQMHGHTIGDLLLENTGIRIQETIRKSDYTFRWEGTNLVVLLPELATPLDAIIVAEKIQSAVTVPYRFRKLDLAPDCHIGISLYPTDATDVDDLFDCANSAVIEAEQQGVPFLHYDKKTHQAASERLILRTDLQRAFEREELELYYQPIVDPTGRICGAEALMRWNHPERGLLAPADFINVAEDSRLIAPIDKLALYNAARSIVEWSAHYDIFVTMNISAVNIADSSLPIVVEQAIRDAGLENAARLKLELTESRTIENSRYSKAAMDELTAMGVDIWIDDFGTGQSSLSYLKYLPVSTVKIDKDFIAELGQNSEDIDYLKSIINTIRSRGKQVVVEGVATDRQYELVRSLPIDYLQGFYFAQPIPAPAFYTLLRSRSNLP